MVLVANRLVILAQVFVRVCRSVVDGGVGGAASFCNLGAVGQRNGNAGGGIAVYVFSGHIREVESGGVQEGLRDAISGGSRANLAGLATWAGVCSIDQVRGSVGLARR